MKMFIGVVSSLLVGMSANAQQNQVKASVESSNRSFAIVPTIGLGYSKMSIDGKGADSISDINRPYLGLSAGLLAEFGSGEVQFQTGLQYLRETTQLKQDVSFGSSSGSYKSTVAVEHIGIPLIAKFRGIRSSRSSLHFRAGVIPAYATGVSYENESSSNIMGTSTSSKNSGWTREDLRSINVIALIGGGVDVPMSSGNDLRFELNLDRSLLPLNREADNIKIYSQSLLLSIGMVL